MKILQKVRCSELSSGDQINVGIHRDRSGHLDTKPVGDRNRWACDPYRGKVEGGRLYGLGSGDMKAAVAAMIYAAAALKAVGVSLDGDLWLAFTADEEAGSDGRTVGTQ